MITSEFVWYGSRCGDEKIASLGDVSDYLKKVARMEDSILLELHD